MIVDVDTSNFSAMCNELATRLQIPPEEALREEAGRVFTRTIELTDSADVSKIRRRFEQARFSLQPTTLYHPTRPDRRHIVSGKVLYNLSYRYPNALWNAIQAARSDDLKLIIAARGLAKQSWWRIVEMLGLSADAPEYVKKAVPRTGRFYPQDERVHVLRRNGEISYEFENSQPTVNAIHGERALQQAINGRVKFFVTNLSHDVFKTIEAIAKKYPGVEVTHA